MTMTTALDIGLAVGQCKSPLDLLAKCGGYYECPKGESGKRLGPLVAYRGTYGPDDDKKRFVGDVYVNFAKAEQWPFAANHFAKCLMAKLSEWSSEIDVFCGAPEGGKSLADKLALLGKRRYVYPEKKGGELVWGRHQVERGEKVVIVEDVANNFSTTEKLVFMIIEAGGMPIAIACFLNRSMTVDKTWRKKGFPDLPVVPVVRKKFANHRQDDEEVAADVQAGNVVWNVKDGWSTLMEAMSQHSK